MNDTLELALAKHSYSKQGMAHLSTLACQQFRTFMSRRIRIAGWSTTYNRLPSPRKMQTLVQVWKQLRKWRSGGESASSFQQENKRPVMGSLKSAARLNNRRQLRICKKYPLGQTRRQGTIVVAPT